MKARKIIKYGVLGTVSAAAGASLAGGLAAPYGFRIEAAKEAAVSTAVIGAGLTAGILGRKQIGRAVIGAGRAVAKGMRTDMRVVFRKIRGRIVPVKVKA